MYPPENSKSRQRRLASNMFGQAFHSQAGQVQQYMRQQEMMEREQEKNRQIHQVMQNIPLYTKAPDSAAVLDAGAHSGHLSPEFSMRLIQDIDRRNQGIAAAAAQESQMELEAYQWQEEQNFKRHKEMSMAKDRLADNRRDERRIGIEEKRLGMQAESQGLDMDEKYRERSVEAFDKSRLDFNQFLKQVNPNYLPAHDDPKSTKAWLTFLGTPQGKAQAQEILQNQAVKEKLIRSQQAEILAKGVQYGEMPSRSAEIIGAVKSGKAAKAMSMLPEEDRSDLLRQVEEATGGQMGDYYNPATKTLTDDGKKLILGILDKKLERDTYLQASEVVDQYLQGDQYQSPYATSSGMSEEQEGAQVLQGMANDQLMQNYRAGR